MKAFNSQLLQLIISTNGHKNFFTRVNQEILFNYINEFLFKKNCKPLLTTGHANHVHICLYFPIDLSINILVKEMCQNTVDFLRCENSVFPEFNGWDSDFISISYHFSQESSLVESLKDHFNYHRKISFEEELDVFFTEIFNS